ncbi:nucleotidyltransferase domain-containing protein [Corynebacterium matruchotii]|jgi:hypothetical protein|uniref:Polymerase nucleotidyl transferase domain-containing protein n=1 Tax=Corynebacterium matruchotii ATCC 33806 TaxID=566549 RepID=C0E5K5_9CORY|nr:nucleotidyltransferase domain-containing protein [Corynebacterium matruchotii]EEG26192.1 hypothetical protein CORMATOL_02295 [Corynebacterium matruchotii ATCC 33806]
MGVEMGFFSPGLYSELLARMELSVEEVPALFSAANRSASAIDRARKMICSYVDQHPKHIRDIDDIVAFGSLARYELTPNSDLDYLTISENPESSEIPDAIINNIRRTMVTGSELKKPGTTGIFGKSINPKELISNIGLQRDTNEILTRRVLFLEESVSLMYPEKHRDILWSIVNTYLDARERKGQTPRYLLNDIIRYWRTIAIDYQAKIEGNKPKALRHVKLLIPRKLCFISSLAPLYLHHLDVEKFDSEPNFLVDSYLEPSSIRLMRLLTKSGTNNSLQQRIVKTLDFFIEKSSDAMWRKNIEEDIFSNQFNHSPSGPYWEIRERSRQLHKDLTELLFSDNYRSFTEKYMVI